MSADETLVQTVARHSERLDRHKEVMDELKEENRQMKAVITRFAEVSQRNNTVLLMIGAVLAAAQSGVLDAIKKILMGAGVSP